jgi:hypothetical protein
VATFLQLVNDVERESGTISQSQRLTTVAGAIGRQEKIVHWTRQAWEMIQRERSDWLFRSAQFTGDVVAGDSTYSATDLGITNFAGWEQGSYFTIYDPALGRGDETVLREITFREWYNAYGIGLPDSNRPVVIAQGDDRSLYLGPPPMKPYKLRGFFRRSFQSLTADNDVPFIDPEYHQAIVWRALMLLAEDDEAQFEIATSGRQYDTIFSRMVATYTGPIEL